MPKKLIIFSISSEVAPFSKTGGLADVARSLPKALKRLGQNISIITPLYDPFINKKEHNLTLLYQNLSIKTSGIKFNVWQNELMKGLPVYLIEIKKHFSGCKWPYGAPNDNEKFYYFNCAALELIKKINIIPNIIHCHDWQTGLIPYLLKNKYKKDLFFKDTKTVFTIHNLVFQLGKNWWDIQVKDRDFGKKQLPNISSQAFNNINFAKRAILNADVINTVSEQYREEILTKKFGQDLHRILKNRADKVFGIINGIDYHDYNPERDKNLYKNYDFKKIYRKKQNKEYLQKILGLTIDKNIPIIGLTSRVTFQKGFELFNQIVKLLLNQNLEIIIMGDGDKNYINELKKHNKRYSDKIIWVPFKKNEKLETLIYASADIFLLPSHHEPCGINQLIAMRYGTIPVVRSVGGLNDTVENFNPTTKKGTGFSFKEFSAISLYGAIIRALENYYNKENWKILTARAMKQANGWQIPAKKYLELYKKTIKN